MKEAIIVNLDGYLTDVTLVDATTIGVSPIYEQPQPGNEEEPLDPVLVGHTVAVPVRPGLYNPRFDLTAWDAYQEAVKAYREALEAWTGAEEGTPMPTSTADISTCWIEGSAQSTILESLKESKIISLDQNCNQAILSGFTSSALGEDHSYDFDFEAQINFAGMMNAVTAGLMPELISWKTESGYLPHTLDQFKHLYMDGLQHKQTLINKYNGLKSQVKEATIIEQLDTIIWE